MLDSVSLALNDGQNEIGFTLEVFSISGDASAMSTVLKTPPLCACSVSFHYLLRIYY